MPYGKFAYVYDRLMDDMPYTNWLRFLRHNWDTYGHKPHTVADLGCGTGNVSIPLAQSGFCVYGIDLSDDMLAVAQEKTEQQQRSFSFVPGGSVRWLQQDLREWELPEQVDAVISCCDCLNYLTEEEDLIETFQRTYAGLKEDGTFVFDMHTISQLASYAEMQPFLLKEDDVSYIWTSDYDEDRHEIEHDLSIFVLDEDAVSSHGRASYVRIDETHVQRAYPLDWIEQQLREAGFAEVHQFADFRQQQPNASTERAFFVAIKRG